MEDMCFFKNIKCRMHDRVASYYDSFADMSFYIRLLDDEDWFLRKDSRDYSRIMTFAELHGKMRANGQEPKRKAYAKYVTRQDALDMKNSFCDAGDTQEKKEDGRDESPSQTIERWRKSKPSFWYGENDWHIGKKTSSGESDMGKTEREATYVYKNGCLYNNSGEKIRDLDEHEDTYMKMVYGSYEARTTWSTFSKNMLDWYDRNGIELVGKDEPAETKGIKEREIEMIASNYVYSVLIVDTEAQGVVFKESVVASDEEQARMKALSMAIGGGAVDSTKMETYQFISECYNEPVRPKIDKE